MLQCAHIRALASLTLVGLGGGGQDASLIRAVGGLPGSLQAVCWACRVCGVAPAGETCGVGAYECRLGLVLWDASS